MADSSGGGRSGRTDPDVQFSFFVEIDGIQCVKFTEAKGLEWKAEPVSFHEGGNFRHKVNLVGPGSFSPLVLKKGFFSASGEFFEWIDSIMNPGKTKVKRASMSVVACDAEGTELARYNLYGAIMTRYSGPGFDANQSAVGFEEIEITYDHFEFEAGKGGGGALQSGQAAGNR